MNERIKQLAFSSGLSRYGDLGMRRWEGPRSDCISDQDLEKFAELIVRECMEQVRGEYLPVLEDKEMMKDTHWDGYVQCGVDSYVAIREHFFGVEE